MQIPRFAKPFTASFFSNAINASVDVSERMSTFAAAILKTFSRKQLDS
jgi:hypothetical protein